MNYVKQAFYSIRCLLLSTACIKILLNQFVFIGASNLLVIFAVNYIIHCTLKTKQQEKNLGLA